MPSPTLLDLSRLQFFVTAAFHMTFPAVSVGLSVFLVVVYAAYRRTHDPLYLAMYRFWRKIFAIGFGLGVVSGIVLTFEFGLDWGGYAHAVGPILGVIIGMEVITAFFLEAGFAGLMFYGDGRVSERVVFFSTCMVSLGTLLSTTWILAANSWMQTPAGYQVVNGQFTPSNWWHAIFNPAFVWRFPHMLTAVLISACWLLAGVGAYYLLKGRHLQLARRTVSLGLGTALVLVPVQLYLGDSLAGFMAVHQPAKVQAFEGHWNSTDTGYPLFVVPDDAQQRNRLMIEIPKVGSVINKDYTLRTPTPGLQETPRDRRPAMLWPFYGFRFMFFSALIMFATAFAGLVLRLRGHLYGSPRFHRWLVAMIPIGVFAVISGWVTAETGRQPWVVYGQLRTADAVSPLASGQLIASVAAFLAIYLSLLVAYVVAVSRIVRNGPDSEQPLPVPAQRTAAASEQTAPPAGATAGTPEAGR